MNVAARVRFALVPEGLIVERDVQGQSRGAHRQGKAREGDGRDRARAESGVGLKPAVVATVGAGRHARHSRQRPATPPPIGTARRLVRDLGRRLENVESIVVKTFAVSPVTLSGRTAQGNPDVPRLTEAEVEIIAKKKATDRLLFDDPSCPTVSA